MPNISDLDPSDIEPVVAATAPATSAGPNISDLAPEDISYLPGGLDEAKYGGAGQQTIGALEAAGKAGTLGLSTGLEKMAGVPTEDIEGRERALNSVIGIPSQIGGIIAGAMALPEVSAARLMGAAGELGAGALGLGAEGAGALSRYTAAGVKAAIEGNIFQGGNEVSKMILKDPDQTVGTAAANMGLAGLMAVPFGLVGQGAKDLWSAKFGSRVTKSLDNARSEINGEPPDGAAPAAPSAPVPQPGAWDAETGQPVPPEFNPGAVDQETGIPVEPTNQVEAVKEAFAPKTSGIQDTQEAFQRLDIEPPTGTFAETKLGRDNAADLAKRPTFAGVKVGKEYDAAFNKLADTSEDTLRMRTEESVPSVGKKIKEGLHAELEKEYTPLKESYEAHEPHFEAMDVPDDVKIDAIDRVANHPLTRFDKDSLNLSKEVSDSIEAVENVNDVKTLRTSINGKLTKAHVAGDQNAIDILQEAKNALTDMREAAIRKASMASSAPGEGKKIGQSIIESIRDTDAKYRNLKARLQQLGVESGNGKLNSVGDLLKRFGKISDESMVGKILDVNDINQMRFFKENFPEQFELARQAKLQEIYEKSIIHVQGEKGRFDTGNFLRQVRKMTPEAREIVFGRELTPERLEDINTVYENIPGNKNYSNTAYHIAFGHAFSVQGAMENVSDVVRYAMLKASPHLSEAIDAAGGGDGAKLAALKFAHAPGPGNASAFYDMKNYLTQTIKGESTLSKGVDALFKAGSEVIPSHLIPDDKQKEKLSKKISDLQSNNMDMQHVGGDIGHYLPDHATSIAKTAASAVQYLSSLKPNEQKNSVLDSDPVPSDAAKATYDRALAIAEQPLMTLKHIKSGTLSAQDVATVKAIYPGFHARTSQKIVEQMAEAVKDKEPIPYKTRMGLALFLGYPLDSTMTPSAIQSLQMSHGPTPNQAAQGQGRPQQGPHSMKNITKLATSAQTPDQARQAARLKG